MERLANLPIEMLEQILLYLDEDDVTNLLNTFPHDESCLRVLNLYGSKGLWIRRTAYMGVMDVYINFLI